MSKKNTTVVSYDEPVIIVAEDFTPSETLQLDKSKILAFVTSKGSLNSHTAILARTMNIPAIIGADVLSNKQTDGKLAVIDGFNGTIYIEPDEEFLRESYARLKEEKEKVQNIVIEEMEKAYSMQVPLCADCGWGNNWLEAH